MSTSRWAAPGGGQRSARGAALTASSAGSLLSGWHGPSSAAASTAGGPGRRGLPGDSRPLGPSPTISR